MPSKLVRHGRVRGFRPTVSQLQELLELAQRGIGEAGASASLVYSQGDLEFYPKGDLGKILPGNLDEIIVEAERPDDLNNLSFSVGQADQSRQVSIQIGPGNWTTYRVESDDQTWAYGRYHELTDRLLRYRGLYAKFRAPAPETLEEGTGDRWRSAPWEAVTDWRMTLVAGACIFMPIVMPIIIIGLLLSPLGYYLSQKTLTHQQVIDAGRLLERSESTRIAAILAVTYLAAIMPYRRWLKSLLKSGVTVSKSARLAQFNFRTTKADPIVLASFYVTCVGILLAVIIPFL